MTAPGGLELSQLIKSMKPTLADGIYVFATISPQSEILGRLVLGRVEMLCREDKGWTLVVPQAVAIELELESIFPCRKITLDVHSSLEAVGFLAAVTNRLADKLKIGVNPVSGYYHDHLYVPAGKEELVVEELKRMAAEQQ
ncbi:hypothetical protein LTR08_004247 [Meristemomyces frigidus]|nr:hypothetical protein LTR08_004247 [Meristemomyces frigidus]